MQNYSLCCNTGLCIRVHVLLLDYAKPVCKYMTKYEKKKKKKRISTHYTVLVFYSWAFTTYITCIIF